MAVCPIAYRFTWRTKYLLLLVFGVCMIVWIKSLASGYVKTPKQVLTSTEAQIQKERTEGQMEMEQQDEVAEERMQEDLCPEKSPLLREFYCETTLSANPPPYFNSGRSQATYNYSSAKQYLKKKKSLKMKWGKNAGHMTIRAKEIAH